MPVLLIASALLFLICSAVFSASETALFSIPRERVWGFRNSGSPSERRLFELLIDGQRTLLLILLGNIFVNVTLVGLIHAVVRYYGVFRPELITMAVATPLILLFGEIIPKNVALRNNEWISRGIAPVFYHVSVALRPLLNLARWVNMMFLRILGRHLREPSPFITLEELNSAAEEFAAQGVIEAHERDSILAVLLRGAHPVRRFMNHRSQMAAVPEQLSCAEALALLRHARQTTGLVYRRGRDDVPLGVVYASALLALPGEAPLRDHLREVDFVPGSMPTAEVVGLMVRERLSGVCVLDEYGGYAGFFSIMQGLESVLSTGEHGSRESGDADTAFEREVDGLEHIETLKNWIPASMLDAAAEVRTLNGLLINYLGRIPETGEQFAVDEVSFYIIDAGAAAVRRVRILRRGRTV